MANYRADNILDTKLRWFESDSPDNPSLEDRLVEYAIIEPVGRLRTLFPKASRLHKISAEHWFVGSPVVQCFDEIYLSVDQFPEINETTAQSLISNTYGFYQSRFNLTISAFDDRARAVFLTVEQCQKAGVGVPYPVISVERRAFLPDKTLLEYRIRVLTTDDQYLRLTKDIE